MSEQAKAVSREERFVTYLEQLEHAEDRAALAALRRSLGKSPGEASEAHRYVLRFNPPVREEETYYLIGALFALHP
jgi:CRISPR system Cascade subunit CasB